MNGFMTLVPKHREMIHIQNLYWLVSIIRHVDSVFLDNKLIYKKQMPRMKYFVEYCFIVETSCGLVSHFIQDQFIICAWYKIPETFTPMANVGHSFSFILGLV